jgi:DNA polymerase-3 subunit gamma/tau
MSTQAESLGVGSLTRFAEITHSGLVEMRGATAPRLLLELLCARMLLPAAAEGDSAVLHRLERLERRLTITPPSPAPPPAATEPNASAAPSRIPGTSGPDVARPEPQHVPAHRPDPGPATAAPAPRESAPVQLDAAEVRRHWPALLDAVREQSRATQVLFSNSTASAVEGSTLVLSLPTAPLARRLGEDRNVEMIKRALHKVLGVDWQVRCEHASGGGGPSGAQQRAVGRPARPSQRPPERPASRRLPGPPPPEDEVPPPPEPQDLRDPVLSSPPDDEAMQPASRQDPEEVAMALLAEQLGARRIDPS